MLLILKPEQTYSHKDSIVVVDTWQVRRNIVKKSQVKMVCCHDKDTGEHHDSEHVKNVKYSYFFYALIPSSAIYGKARTVSGEYFKHLKIILLRTFFFISAQYDNKYF